MPKLSQQTLEKRFRCPYCSVTLRTRQGLSGHIQFKHPKGTAATKEKSIIDTLTEKMILQRCAQSGGITEAEFHEMEQIRADWYFIKAGMGEENVKFNDTDYKTYLLIAMALMYGNQRLINKFNKDLGAAIEQLIEIFSKMATKSK